MVESLQIPSPFVKQIHLFDSDDDDSFSDLDFAIPGIAKPLHLHIVILAQASAMIVNLFKTKQNIYVKYSAESHRVD